MIPLLSVLLILGALLYGMVLLLFFVGLFRLQGGRGETIGKGRGKSKEQQELGVVSTSTSTCPLSDAQPTVSVIVPARDEEQNIGRCLTHLIAQTYPRDRYEIIVVDDQSTDRTAHIMRSFMEKHDHVRLIQINACPPGISPKKHAVKRGIEVSSGEILFSTDADCIMKPGWIEGMTHYFDPDVGMVAGLTMYDLSGVRHSFLQHLQALDFLSHSFCAAGAVGIGWPINANANNLAYRRRAFEDVRGFGGFEHMISGDDDLLLQRVARETPWKIRFAVNEDTFIQTRPVQTFRGFAHQRMRWASKGLHYRGMLKVFLGGAFLFFVLLFVTVPLSMAGWLHTPVPLFCLLGKIIVEGMVIVKGCMLFRRPDMLKYFLPAEIVHIPYILSAAIGGQFFKFEWKGRRTGKVAHP